MCSSFSSPSRCDIWALLLLVCLFVICSVEAMPYAEEPLFVESLAEVNAEPLFGEMKRTRSHLDSVLKKPVFNLAQFWRGQRQ
ncbi:unnamed protein product, partial [Mesorhabditis spiculigera]